MEWCERLPVDTYDMYTANECIECPIDTVIQHKSPIIVVQSHTMIHCNGK